jgi:hypothetical protein
MMLKKGCSLMEGAGESAIQRILIYFVNHLVVHPLNQQVQSSPQTDNKPVSLKA